MSAYTPGPWVVLDEHPAGVKDRSVMAVDQDGHHYYVATVHDTASHDGCWAADARLVAASPELLEALRVVEQAGLIRQDGVIDAGVLAAVQGVARAAIVKATGGTP